MNNKIKQTGKFIITIILIIVIYGQNCAQEKKKIEIINSDVLSFNADISSEYRSLVGNVQLRHNNIIMFCDSAHFYNESNKVDAFSRVHINQNDTLHLYGDRLFYDGNLKTAKVDGNVRLIDRQMTLTTPDLFYDFNTSIATYNRGGKIVNKENTLISTNGSYNSKQKLFSFSKDVKMTNPRYVMTSDTLKYHTVTRITYFYGHTKIIGDTNKIYCKSGWYDTQKEISQFNHNATLIRNDQILKGDSLYYNRNSGFGKAIGAVELTDTTKKLTISGDYGERNEISDFAFVTGKTTLCRKFFKTDTLYMHADTLFSIVDTIPEERIIKAYHKVKLFKPDLQGLCDSLVYTSRDSLIRLFKAPIIWSDSNQLTGEYIELKTSQKEILSIFLKTDAFITSEVDSNAYNQIKGKTINGYFSDNQLTLIKVEGNAQSIYYAKEEDGSLIGINKSKSSTMRVNLYNQKIKQIIFYQEPDATLFPQKKLSKNDQYLNGFVWHKNKRPASPKDIY